MRIRRKNPIGLIAALWMLSVWLHGCGIVIMDRGLVIDEPFTEKMALLIRHNETTKKDILDWFGPPAALARPGTVTKVPHWSKSGSASSDVPADDFFKRFVAAREQVQKPLVYYYEAARLDWTEFYWWLFNGAGPLYIPPVEKRPLTIMTLWVLVDEESGNVVDHHVEMTAEGRSEQETPDRPAADAEGAKIP
jgi:hypothetical protein